MRPTFSPHAKLQARGECMWWLQDYGGFICSRRRPLIHHDCEKLIGGFAKELQLLRGAIFKFTVLYTVLYSISFENCIPLSSGKYVSSSSQDIPFLPSTHDFPPFFSPLVCLCPFPFNFRFIFPRSSSFSTAFSVVLLFKILPPNDRQVHQSKNTRS